MAAKKNNRKKHTKSNKTARKPSAKKFAHRKATPKRTARKKAQKKKSATTNSRKSAGRKKVSVSKKRLRDNDQAVDTARFSLGRTRARSGGQAGDLQGLSSVERAQSESVDELLEEGNAFEAEIVAGVEDAENADEEEVRTHEVPEDDVPGEYVDKD